ncbi:MULTISPECIES: type IV secretion system protein VirB10 [Paenalcaligenes]|uniref:TrbI/VirB10 family protein n=1 Tax=Paenalcaligenes hermetiae TaxID=1157987 RepID=A0ABP9MA00_9BURK|nr:type IV secretion system protein VirB10 [Paenalcaligenes sp.]
MSIFKRNTDEDALPNEIAPTLSESLQAPELERGLPQSLHNHKQSNVKKAALAGVGVLGLGLLLSGLVLNRETPQLEQEEVFSESVANQRPRDFSAEQQKILEQLQEIESQRRALEESQSEIKSEPQIASASTVVVTEPDAPRRELQGSVLVAFSEEASVPRSMEATYAAPARETAFSEQLRPSLMLPGRAIKRADLTYLLGKGTTISCTLNTKIVTTQPGITRCIVNQDVYSKNGKVLLIERGSEVIGEQMSALLHGQARVFVLWNTIETPSGVSVEINSPTADSLGAAGQEAYVETHFWQRFSGAIMLSMIDDVISIAANSNRSRDRHYQFDHTRDSTRDMAAIALENTINIPPTGYVNQGTLVNIMVARDVDFSDIYQLVNIETSGLVRGEM